VKFLSVCSGIEAASVAWNPLGWKAAAFSEIEPFPCSVLAHHYPDTPNRGDMTKFKDWPNEPIDLLCGGTPCQSFSVAGLRKGLDDPRGNLMLTFGAIAAKYRPRWLVWENVPGVLSSNGGRDFGAFLGLLGVLGYGFAYRVLDAQYFGVAQRRRRVFVVGCLGDWRSAAAVLFERHSLQGHPAPRRETGKSVAGSIRASAAKRGGIQEQDGGSGLIPQPAELLCVATGQAGADMGADMAPTLNCNHEAPYIAGSLTARGARNGGQSNDDIDGNKWVVTHSLRGEGFDASEDGTGRGTPLVPAIAFDCKASGRNGFGIGEIASTQRAMGHANSHTNGGGHQAVMAGMQVRLLTPRECERLHGFPSIHELIRINACIDHQSGSVDVALSCLRWPSNASRADAERFMPSAGSAAQALSTSQAGREPLAALRARLGSEAEPLELRSHGRSIWSASSAGASNLFLPPTQIASIAGAVAKRSQCLGLEVRSGKVELHLPIRLSIPGLSGAQSVPKSGAESAASASDAKNDAPLARFTTSDLGRLVPSTDSPAATLLCSVLAAISGCIPSETLPDSFSFEIDVEADYTAIPHRGKPAADGPRYKALGNSWAVPVVRWIGERIAAVDALRIEKREAA
jgi:DNA (cytosine-5)-methyltransferase 1